MAGYAVELRAVWKRFLGPAGETVAAVKELSLQIADGEFFALLGPSGCGKTTTLRMVAGFELPSAGEVLIQGKPMGKTPPYQRPVNTVFQNYALFPHMTIGENVAFGLQMQKVGRQEVQRRVGAALEMVRLSGLERRRPKQLSGGQQQRVALARALVNRPQVLLLDEPLGALDLKLRKEMQLELKKLQREVGITFVFVTHDQEEALTMSDRIAVMDAGVALQVGSATQIYEQPNCRFVADFIGETNFLEGSVQQVQEGQALVALPGGLPVWASMAQPVAVGNPVTVAVRPEKLTLRPLETLLANQLQGQVVDQVYIGPDTYYSVRLASGQTIRVREQNNLAALRQGAQPGDTVCVQFAAETASVLTG